MAGDGLVWLVLRLLRSDIRRAKGALVALCLGAIVLGFVGSATAAAPKAIGKQQERTRALSPTVRLGDEKALEGDLRVLNPALVSSRRWDGHAIHRQYFQGKSDNVQIPGVPRVPERDEYFASPALVELVKSNSVVAALFDNRRLVGTIQESGLVQPHELRAVAGADQGEWALMDVVGFGDPSTNPDVNRVLDVSVGLIVFACIWVPGIALMVVGARMAGARRARRSRSLRMLGVPASLVRLILASEIAIVTLVGGTLGALGFEWCRRNVTRVPGTDEGYFASDAHLPPFALIGVVGVLVVLSAAAAVHETPVDTVGQGQQKTRTSAAPRFGKLGFVVFGISLAYLVAMPVLVKILQGNAVFGMWLADALIAVGLALAGPQLVALGFRGLARRARRAGTLVGMRLPSIGSLSSMRQGALLAVIIVLTLGALSFSNILQKGGQSTWTTELRQNPQVPIVTLDINGTLTHQEVANAARGAPVALSIEGRVDGVQIPVVVADCRSLSNLAGEDVSGCEGHVQRLVRDGAASIAPLPAGPIEFSDGKSVAIPRDSQPALLSPRLPDEWNGALLVPPEEAPGPVGGEGFAFFVLVPSHQLDSTLATIDGLAPTAQFDLGSLAFSDPNVEPYPGHILWLIIGAIAALSLGALGLILVIGGESRERSVKFRGLRTAGAPRSDLVRAHAWSTGGPLVAMGWLGVATGLVVAMAMRAFDDRAHIEIRAAGILAAGALLCGIVASVATWPQVLRVSNRSGGLDA